MVTTAFFQIVCIYVAYEYIIAYIDKHQERYNEDTMTVQQLELVEEEKINEYQYEQVLLATNL